MPGLDNILDITTIQSAVLELDSILDITTVTSAVPGLDPHHRYHDSRGDLP